MSMRRIEASDAEPRYEERTTELDGRYARTALVMTGVALVAMVAVSALALFW